MALAPSKVVEVTRAEWNEPRKREGDSVTTAGRAPPTHARLDVLYIDDEFLVVNKPEDVRMDGDFDLTLEKLANALLHKRGCQCVGGVRLRFVHQLDYATSGVLLFALTRSAAAFVSRQFEHRTVHKCYLAVVYGTMSAGTHIFDADIADHQNDAFKMAVGSADNPGRPALTRCTPLAYGRFGGQPVTKLLLQPSTGRRHQLRIHLLNAAHPIVGDATYSGDSEEGPDSPKTPFRMMLHAWRLRINLPPPRGEVIFCTEDPFDAYFAPWSPLLVDVGALLEQSSLSGATVASQGCTR